MSMKQEIQTDQDQQTQPHQTQQEKKETIPRKPNHENELEDSSSGLPKSWVDPSYRYFFDGV